MTTKQECGEALVSSGQSMAPNKSDGALVSVFTLYLPFVFVKFSNSHWTRCTFTEFIEQYPDGTFNEVALVKSLLAIS